MKEMLGKIKVMCCILLVAALTASFLNVQCVPQMPHRFYGYVTVDEAPAPDGTLITAKIAGVTYASTTTVDGKYGYTPAFNVPADDPDTPEKEGGQTGDTIEFYVAGKYATSYTFEYGGITYLNLTITAPTPPTVTIINPTTTNPAYARSGTTIQVTYRYTESNPKNATIKIYNSTGTWVERTITDLAGGANVQRIDNITIPANAADGSYHLNVTIYNIYDLGAPATELDAVKIDNTKPEISSPYQDPPGQVVQPGETVNVEPGYNITVRVNVTELNIQEVFLYYNVSATEWIKIQMTPTASGEYTATIPSSSYPPCTTIQYYIEAMDKAGNTAQTPTAGVYFTSHIITEYQKIVLTVLLPAIALITALNRKRKRNSS
jgi:hypothetical protein